MINLFISLNLIVQENRVRKCSSAKKNGQSTSGDLGGDDHPAERGRTTQPENQGRTILARQVCFVLHFVFLGNGQISCFCRIAVCRIVCLSCCCLSNHLQNMSHTRPHSKWWAFPFTIASSDCFFLPPIFLSDEHNFVCAVKTTRKWLRLSRSWED